MRTTSCIFILLFFTSSLTAQNIEWIATFPGSFGQYIINDQDGNIIKYSLDSNQSYWQPAKAYTIEKGGIVLDSFSIPDRKLRLKGIWENKWIARDADGNYVLTDVKLNPIRTLFSVTGFGIFGMNENNIAIIKENEIYRYDLLTDKLEITPFQFGFRFVDLVSEDLQLNSKNELIFSSYYLGGSASIIKINENNEIVWDHEIDNFDESSYVKFGVLFDKDDNIYFRFRMPVDSLSIYETPITIVKLNNQGQTLNEIELPLTRVTHMVYTNDKRVLIGLDGRSNGVFGDQKINLLFLNDDDSIIRTFPVLNPSSGIMNIQLLQDQNDLYLHGFFNSDDQYVGEDYVFKISDLLSATQESILENSGKIIPNPSDNIISIEEISFTKNTRVEIRNSIGELMITAKSKDINISELVSGLYYATIHQAGKMHSLKFIKH